MIILWRKDYSIDSLTEDQGCVNIVFYLSISS